MKKLFICQTLGDKTNNSVLHTLIYFMTSYFISIFPPQTWNKQTKKCRAVKRENNFDRCLIGKSISHLHIKIICQCTLNISLPTQVFFAQFCTRCRENWKYSRSNFFSLHPGQRLKPSLDNLISYFSNLLKTRFGYNHVSTPKSFIGAFWNIFRLLHDFYEFRIVMSSHRISP